MRTTLLVASLACLALSACGETRRPGGSGGGGGGGNRDAASAADAGMTQDAQPLEDANPNGDAVAAPDAPAEDVGPTLDATPSFDARPGMDAVPAPDAIIAPDAFTFPDATTVDGGSGSAQASQQIAAARALPAGPAAATIDGAYVTYVRNRAIGIDPAGFMVQGERDGPAIFVAVDPATLSPAVQVGDIVSLTVSEIAADAMNQLPRTISALSSHRRTGTVSSVEFLVQDVNTAPDLVSNVTGYETELLRATVTISSAVRAGGTGFSTATVTTTGIPADPLLELRVPTPVVVQQGLGPGCSATLTVPLWRFTTRPQFMALDASELQGLTCPAARVVGLAVPSPTRVAVLFDRRLDPASVLANGAQLSATMGLSATAARVTTSAILFTTTPQVAGASYAISVATSVRDTRGASIDAAFASGNFAGAQPRPTLLVNELSATITGGCDLIELRVRTGGSLDGYSVRSRDQTLVTFSGLTVSPNDLILIHANGSSATCNPGAAPGETGSPASRPTSTYANNVDTAYDWHAMGGGLVATDTVITILDDRNEIIDAVLFSDAPTGTAANGSEDAAAAAELLGEWTTASGVLPVIGFVDDDFSANAVQGLSATATTRTGTSLQRSRNQDANSAADWQGAPAASSWGLINAGQTPF